MNTNLYRIVFNRSRGLWMAVAETVRSHGGGNGKAAPRMRSSRGARLTPTRLALSLALGSALSGSAYAQIVADPSAPTAQQPHIHGAANGVPLVDITRPSAAGVSRNTYSQFDVQNNGAILNNARRDTQTTLGGWVPGNAALSAGSARVILNEVNSASPSQLLGYLEVAGSRAEVVVANPSGITCNGCGFINASRSTLTTGQAQMDHGHLTGYRVEGGTVRFEGAGLDARSTDFASVIARAVEINANLWGQHLSITAGTGMRSVDGTPGDSLEEAASSPAPALAIDVSALGGMYAGKITMVGTEAGVGVRNAGHLGASNGQLVVTANGRLENLGEIEASGALALTSSETLTNRGLIDGAAVRLEAATLANLDHARLYGDVIALSADTLLNAGDAAAGTAPVVASRGDIDIAADTFINRDEALVLALGDVRIGGALTAAHRAEGRATHVENASATLEAVGSLSITTETLHNADTRFAATTVEIASEDIEEYQRTSFITRYSPDEVSTYLGRPNSQQWVLYLSTPDGNGNDWYHYEYTRSTHETRVTDQRAAALVAGSNLQIDAKTVLNDKSLILAGGTLDVQADELINLDAEGYRITADQGTATRYYRIRRGQGGINQPQGISRVNYAPAAEIETFTLSSTQLAGHTDLDGNTSDAGLTLPASRLFQPLDQPTTYLIETDPRFTRFEQWLSSDYMLERLGYNPLEVGLRLGDGFYEQQLVREQIAELTGHVNPGGHASYEAQYRALLEAGIAMAEEWGLVPGVALTAEQVSVLTSDMVWLIERTITLADGSTQQVLVPQVYARVREGDLDGSGALIAGRDLTLEVAGTTLNQGRILAQDTATVRTDTLLNKGGELFATTLDIQADTDIANVGGRIGAVEALSLAAGRDLMLTGATYTSVGEADGSGGVRSGVSRPATLYVSGAQGTLVASAGRDFGAAAAQILNQGEGATVIAAARDVVLTTQADLRSETIASSPYHVREETELREIGTQINGGGELSILAGQDVAVRGADVTAASLDIAATRDAAFSAAEHHAGVAVDSTDRVSGRLSTWRLEQTGVQSGTLAADDVLITAGRDQTHNASHIASSNSTTLAAGRDLTLATATASDARDFQRGDGRNWRTETSTQEVGSLIESGGDITLFAGQDLAARGAQVVSSDGGVSAHAERDLTLEAAQSTYELDAATDKKRRGFLSSKTTTTRHIIAQTVHHGSLRSGETVTATAGQDVSVTGSQVVSTDATVISAGRDLDITAATDTLHETNLRSVKRSGLFSSGGLGVTIGSSKLSTDQGTDSTYAAGSTVASLEGDVTLLAGQHYRQEGSDVLAPQGNIAIAAERVDIVEARESARHTYETRAKQSGITLALTSPVISAVQTAQQMHEAASNTSDGRMKALAAATAGFSAKGAYDAVKAGQGTDINGQSGQIAMGKDEAGNIVSRDANAADKVGGINISISLGSSKSSSSSTQTSDTAAGSTVAAGGDVTIVASGAGEDSDLTVRGSHIEAGRDLTLAADNDIALLAAANTATQRSNNSSSSASVGIGFALGGTQQGFTIQAGVSRGKGKANGDDLAWSNTHVVAGDTLTLQSGADTTLAGAVATGEQVVANVGGDLVIESLQDVSTYDSKQKNAGASVSLCIPPFCVGAPSTGNISFNQSRIDSDYASVTEQSAIRAGDAGFQVSVGGDTTLTGGAITSTDTAVDEGFNTFETGGELALLDLENRASYKAKAVGVSIGVGTSSDGKLAPQGTGTGVGQDSGKASSTTEAAISGIAGDTDARTGDAETGIKPIFDANKVQREIDAQVVITQAFGREASKAVEEYAAKRMEYLRARYAAETDPDEQIALQAEVDRLRLESHVLNVLIGGVTGLGGSALARESLAAAAEELRKITIENSQLFDGITDGITTLSNVSGVSSGGKWDLEPIKTGGTRVDLDGLCGTDNKRCMTNENGSLALNDKGQVEWNSEGANGQSLADWLETDEGRKMAGLTGGIQGWKGTLFGIPYVAGSWQDRLIEAFGGAHDVIGGQGAGFYDGQGNAPRGRGTAQKVANEIWTAVAIAPSTPFAAATLLPPEVWKAISILLETSK